MIQELGSDTTHRTVLRYSKSSENDEPERNCEAEVQGQSFNPASLEVAAIADTDDDFEFDSGVNEDKFINFEICNSFIFFINLQNSLHAEILNYFDDITVSVQEESLPEGLLRTGKILTPVPMTLQQCQGHRIRLRSQFTSTWLSVAAKNIEQVAIWIHNYFFD